MGLKEMLSADLLTNTGRTGFVAGISGFIFNPGFAALVFHRLAKCLYGHHYERLAKLIWRWNTASTGCHLHLDAQIGPGLMLPHPTGIVVGAGCRIGRGVTLYQNVTLGRSFSADVYPDIDDGVIVFPNAVVIGDIQVGKGAVIGAGAIVLHPVPINAIVAANPSAVLRMRSEVPQT